MNGDLSEKAGPPVRLLLPNRAFALNLVDLSGFSAVLGAVSLCCPEPITTF